MPEPRTISLNCAKNMSSRSLSSFSAVTGSYTFGSSMSASSPSSPVGSGASLQRDVRETVLVVLVLEPHEVDKNWIGFCFLSKFGP
jgi:hypothetical protein